MERITGGNISKVLDRWRALEMEISVGFGPHYDAHITK
jgi:hypothetical protein